MTTPPRNKYRFINLIRFWGIVFLSALAVFIVGIDLAISYHDLSLRAEDMRTRYVEQQKQISKREVERVVNLINFERTQADILTRNKIKTRVDEARAIAKSIYQQNKTAKSDVVIKKMIIDALRPIRFENGSGYYFIIGLDGVGLLLPDKPEIEGFNLQNKHDSHDQYIIKDMIQIAKRFSEGFYEYHWTKPQSTGNDFKKLVFIKRLKPYNWFIGSGLYVNDIEEQVKTRWLDRINSIRYGNNQVGYLFAADWQGNSLAHGAQPDLIGQNGWEWEDSRGNKTSQLLIAASKKRDGGFVNFWWRKPDTGKESAKIAYAKAVPEWQLFIGSGVYIEDIEQIVLPLQNALNTQTKNKIAYFITVVAIAFILFFIAFHFLSNRLKEDLSSFNSFIDQIAFSDKTIDRGTIQFAELDEMAESANKMITDRKEVEKEIHSAKLFIDRVVDMSPYAMWISDNKGMVIRTNRSLRETLKASDEDIVWKYNILKDKNMKEHGVLPLIEAVFEKNEPANFIIPWEAKKGGYAHLDDATDLYMDVSIFPIIGTDGGLTNAVCQWVDITEHKKNEETLRLRTQELDFSREETIQRLARAAEFRDNETAEHNQRMSHYCKLVAERFGMSAERCEKIRLASVMHDIGKIGISDLVLLKPGKLTDEELSLIKPHTEIGYRILSGSRSPLLDLSAIIALTHHEKYDGSGYPRQLAGENIPIEGRIAAVADVFDALTSNRVYREAWSIEQTLELLVRKKRTHFDPLLVDLFLESIDDVLEIRKRHADGSATAIDNDTKIGPGSNIHLP